jgi:hypothetical protein
MTRSEIKSLTEALDSLKIERKELVATREELAESKSRLDDDIAQLGANLKKRLAELEDLQKERDLLEQQATALDERVQRLEQQLGDREESLAELKQSSTAEMARLEELLARALERRETEQTASTRDLQAVEARAAEAEATAEDYLDRLRQAAVYVKNMDESKRMLALKVEALQTQLANALDDLDKADQQLDQQREREATLNRELVGLRGDLKRVAILFDASGSMSKSGRWDEVQKIAATWLDHLEVDECVLIVFSTNVVSFPPDGSWLRVSGPQGRENRGRMMGYLESVQPAGLTNTLAAMQQAYQYEGLDTIILFSDGAPTEPDSGTFSSAAARQIYDLCRQHPEIPVNAIGLGNYFDQNFATFLRSVASLTGGTFIGR